ncbi:sodium- and chloride-dependent glycine transporter 2-like [Penaeus chinensis]|uniref:sodium- and chloride-dependent glycine transporter 2-like n=1 Tax=Penaeus chinensis TaxID=139456 RepID=UPI001FB77844|nr:sodium- and chloride-dependent glycine transporter 2-like [Penaeus chinensis]
MSSRREGQETTTPFKQQEQEEEEDDGRGTWHSKWDYFLSLSGLAIGLGNVWRFPYLCYKNGGGAFLVPYLIMLALVGLPLYLLETGVGQFSSGSPITIYRVCPIFKGIGIAATLARMYLETYYSVVVSYPLVFLYNLVGIGLPWATCDNTWNTDNCSQLLLENNTYQEISTHTRSPADEFFHYQILNISSGVGEAGGFVLPIVLGTVFVWILVFLSIFKGIRVTGKVWGDAASQIFFSLGAGGGALVSLGSYNKFRYNCLRNAYIVPVLNSATSIFAGFVVFSVLGFMAHQTGIPVEKVTTGGPALAFITYPEAVSMMPMAQLWAVLFFTMLFFLGIDSIFAEMESMVLTVTDAFPRLRHARTWVTLAFCVGLCLVALSCCTKVSAKFEGGMYVIQLLDSYCAPYTFIFVGLCEMLVFGYSYGVGRLIRDIQMMTGKVVPYFWYITWLAITPSVLAFIFVNIFARSSPVSYRGVEFPAWAQALGWVIAATSMLTAPLYALSFLVCGSSGSFHKRLSTGLRPSDDWGPGQERFKSLWSEYCSRNALRHRLLHPGPPADQDYQPKHVEELQTCERLIGGGMEPLPLASEEPKICQV